MAAGLLWILDVGNNTAMEPYRAFIADTLDEEQQPVGFQAQSFLQVSVSFSVYIHWNFPLIIVGYTGNYPTGCMPLSSSGNLVHHIYLVEYE
jgi:maltose/moltooligosaccharide transporter